MRKYIWFCTAGVVAFAAGMYVAIVQAGWYPDSLVGRVARFAATAGRPVSPASQAGHIVTSPDSDSEESEYDETVQGELCLPAEPEPAETLPSQPIPYLETEPANVPGRGKFGESAEQEATGPVTDPTAAVHILPRPAPGLADLEDQCPSVMPRCGKDESSPPPVVPGNLLTLPAVKGNNAKPSAGSNGTKCPRCKEGETRPAKGAAPAAKDKSYDAEEQENVPDGRESKIPAELLQKRLDSLLRPYKPCETCPSARKVDTLDFRPSDARKGEFDPIPF